MLYYNIGCLDFDISQIDMWLAEEKEYFSHKHTGNEGTGYMYRVYVQGICTVGIKVIPGNELIRQPFRYPFEILANNVLCMTNRQYCFALLRLRLLIDE
jgi:hypothetical protein